MTSSLLIEFSLSIQSAVCKCHTPLANWLLVKPPVNPRKKNLKEESDDNIEFIYCHLVRTNFKSSECKRIE